ncbi:MAG: bifunctional tRNA (5-methylaminomethyl-2-thiouridine)(34)-methyltransferase MnmD/FAD-dependent 5-carboxymethylaminomethyl-2-thiouridine(34) oxidoreductase MnmC [Parvularculaceae bacterium]
MTGDATTGRARAPNVRCADLDWDAGAPRSVAFDDIYFAGDGLAESRHVFLAGCGLGEKFAALAPGASFALGETGFGTGLNVLAAWELWRATPKAPGVRLDVLSVEKHPLRTDDFRRAAGAWPSLSPFAERLAAVYPPSVSGFHHLPLDSDVTLTLVFEDVVAALGAVRDRIDAWFLDGFAPAKNPDMWRPAAFEAIARLSAPGAALSTFTVAGEVRRRLADVGFAVARAPGFGRKREMQVARYEGPASSAPASAPWFADANETPAPGGAPIAVVGAGVAGASLARALAGRGFEPIVFDGRGPAAGASGNPGGLIMPRFDLGDGPVARFFLQAYTHAVRTLIDLGDERVFRQVGAWLRPSGDDDAARIRKILASAPLPDDWLIPRGDGAFLPQAGVVDPPTFVAALLGDVVVRRTDVARAERRDEDIFLTLTDGGAAGPFGAVVFANGRSALSFFEARTLPLQGVAGQIDWFPGAPAPEFAIAAGPYVAPGPRGGVLFGATYAPGDAASAPAPSEPGTLANVAAGAPLAGLEPAAFDVAGSRPRAAVRCQTPDRAPVAGALPDLAWFSGAYDDLRFGRPRDYPPGRVNPGFYAVLGLGSRGLVTAPLCAEIVANRIAGALSPVPREVAETLHPARFFIRDMKRARTRARR